MSDKKVPETCNHCKSNDIIFHIWGRVEFWSCRACKNEVTYVEPSPWQTWDSKNYGVSDTSQSYTLPTGTKFNDWGFVVSDDDNQYHD